MRLRSIVAAGLAGLFGFPGLALAQVVNGSFEGSWSGPAGQRQPDGWSLIAAFPPDTTVDDSPYSTDGVTSVRIMDNNPSGHSNVGLGQTIDISGFPNGGTVYFDFLLESATNFNNDGSNDTGGGGRIEYAGGFAGFILFADLANYPTVPGTTPDPSLTWRRLSFDFDPGNTLSIGFILNGGYDGTATAYIDNVRVVPEPASLAMLALGGVVSFFRRRR